MELWISSNGLLFRSDGLRVEENVVYCRCRDDEFCISCENSEKAMKLVEEIGLLLKVAARAGQNFVFYKVREDKE